MQGCKDVGTSVMDRSFPAENLLDSGSVAYEAVPPCKQ